mmetsp:Transcript_120881/g.341801  ORF Transcript_120881/g.341801 Transcript_120881/m.341801 type:complete len:254 (+) Transcript_120881:641-1402(+)
MRRLAPSAAWPFPFVCILPASASSIVTSSTMNSVSCDAAQSGTKARFQYSCAEMSTERIELGSTRVSTEAARWQSINGGSPPKDCDVFAGKNTKSSRQMGHSSMHVVLLNLYVLLFALCETRCFESCCFTTADVLMNAVNAWASACLLKKKSMPSFVCSSPMSCRCALCWRMSDSRCNNVLRCSARCRTCTELSQVWLVNAFLQSPHWRSPTRTSTTTVCCTMYAFRASFCNVSLTLSSLECGSVHMKEASTT